MLTSMHWGVYEVETTSAGPRLKPYDQDPDPCIDQPVQDKLVVSPISLKSKDVFRLTNGTKWLRLTTLARYCQILCTEGIWA